VGLASAKVRYDNYKVFRTTPLTTTHLNTLRALENSNQGYSFWTDVTKPGQSVDVLVPPHMQEDFLDSMNLSGIKVQSFIDDVQKTIDSERGLLRAGRMDWNSYHTLDEIHEWLRKLETEFAGTVEVVNAGKSYEGRDLLGVKVSFSKANENRAVFIEGGIHAREWISPATVTYLLNEILRSDNAAIRKMAESYDWYVFPNFNPDGYVYTFEHNRLWRKTRKPYQFCYGTDPNRNWGYKWNTGGASSNPCMETYAGPSAFSDDETRLMSEYITSIQDKLIAYLAFHSYSQLLLIPYGDNPAHVENYDDLQEVGLKAASALAQRFGTKYTVGNIVEVIYVASGGSMDWVKGNYQTPITYTYEGRDLGRYGFLLPASQIIPSGDETMDSLLVIMSEFEKKLN